MVSPSGKPFVVQDNARRLGPWQARVEERAREAGVEGIYADRDAVQVDLAYLLKRPASHLRRDGSLSDSAPYYPTVKKADIDKLERACLDALTEVAFRDDSQVCRVEHEKTYCGGDQTPGVYVKVTVLPDPRKKDGGDRG